MDLSTFPKEEFVNFIIEKFPSALESFLVKRIGPSIKNYAPALILSPDGYCREGKYLHLYNMVESAMSTYKANCINQQTQETTTKEENEPRLIILEDTKPWIRLCEYMKVNNISLLWARLAGNDLAVQMSDQDSFCRLRAYLEENEIDHHICATSGKDGIPLENLQRRKKTKKRSHEINRLDKNRGSHMSKRDVNREPVPSSCDEHLGHNSKVDIVATSHCASTSTFENSTSDIASLLTHILDYLKHKVLDSLDQRRAALDEYSSKLEAIVNKHLPSS